LLQLIDSLHIDLLNHIACNAMHAWTTNRNSFLKYALHSCCTGAIRRAKKLCLATDAPCIIDTTGGDPTCEHGQIGGADDDVCCAASCDKCTGRGCSDGDNLASDCCAGSIRRAAVTCNTNKAPCIVNLGGVNV
jgi:hypothetical protein